MKQQYKETLKLSYNDKKEWWMAKGMESARGPNDYPKLTVKFDEEGLFTFKIINPKGVTFATDTPFGPKKNANNPPDFKHQFEVTGGGTDTLTVKDLNANKTAPSSKYDGGDYVYELNFSNGTTLDPIITNTGCCRAADAGGAQYSFLSGPGLIALILLAAAAIGLIAYRRRSSARTE